MPCSSIPVRFSGLLELIQMGDVAGERARFCSFCREQVTSTFSLTGHKCPELSGLQWVKRRGGVSGKLDQDWLGSRHSLCGMQ